MEELKLENEDQQEQLISMYNRVNDQEKEHNEALESHAAQTEDEVSDMKTQATKDKKDLLKMLSTKFLAEKKALILEMQTKQEQAVIDAESRVRENQISAISDLTTSLNEMCGKKTRDVEKAMR
jgi:hypothetical protein